MLQISKKFSGTLLSLNLDFRAILAKVADKVDHVPGPGYVMISRKMVRDGQKWDHQGP
jgi:hypothetical protein